MKSLSRHGVVLLVAGLLLVLSVGTGATAALVITGKQIKDGTVTGKDVKNRSLAVKDLKRGTKAKLRGATGPAGPVGPRGATGTPGAAGPQGLPGLSGFEVVTRTVTVPGLPSGTPTSVSAACPTGKKAISATASYAQPVNGLLSQVTRQGDAAFTATGLNVLGTLTGQTLTLDVVCATVPS